MSNPLYAFPIGCEQTLRALARYPERTAFSWPGGSITYRGATDLIGRIQSVFMRSLGFAPGTRVAFLTANRADTWCAGVAAQLSRLAITWLHPLGSLDDQLFQLEDSEAQMLVVDGVTFRDRGGELAARATGVKTVFTLGPALRHRSACGDRGLPAVLPRAVSPAPTISQRSITPAAPPENPRARCAITANERLRHRHPGRLRNSGHAALSHGGADQPCRRHQGAADPDARRHRAHAEGVRSRGGVQRPSNASASISRCSCRP